MSKYSVANSAQLLILPQKDSTYNIAEFPR